MLGYESVPDILGRVKSKSVHYSVFPHFDNIPVGSIVRIESIEHQIETHSPSVWVQSEGVSLITDLSLSKKT